VNPPRNRKGGIGNPPPTVGAPELYPNGTKAKAGHSQGEPEATIGSTPEGRVSTVRWNPKGMRRSTGP
jgi:hypothetical protein